MSVSNVEDMVVNNNSTVSVVVSGDITRVRHLTFRNTDPRIRKIDDEHYEIISTGEVKEFVHWDNRSKGLNSLRKTFEKLRDTINANVTNPSACLWVTLTYRMENGEPMTDPDLLYYDFQNFVKKVNQYCIAQKRNYGKPEYICVREPQRTGAWHCHVIFIFPTPNAPYIPNADIEKMWGQGFTSTKKLKSQFGKDIDNVGAYLTAYLGDIPLEEGLITPNCNVLEFEIKEAVTTDEKTGKPVPKKYLKGARLHFYPSNFKLYNTSRGIQKPVKYETTFFQAKKDVSGETLTYSSHKLVDTGTYRTVVSNWYFNSKRQGSQDVINGNLTDIETGEILEENWL